MKSYFVDFYFKYEGSGMYTSFVEADSPDAAIQAFKIYQPETAKHKAYQIDYIPCDCPYIDCCGCLKTAKAHQ